MPTEMQSSTKEMPKERPASELDPQALAAIRTLLEREPVVAAKPVAKREAEKAARGREPVAETAQIPADLEPKQKKSKPSKPQGKGRVSKVRTGLTGYRPSAKHVLLFSAFLFVLFRPVLVLGALVLSLLVLIGVLLILGFDGFWKQMMDASRWYAKRRPGRAAETHRKLERFALKWDAFLDRFPEGTVDGLYLPDLGELAAADARHDAAMDRRFASIRESES